MFRGFFIIVLCTRTAFSRQIPPYPRFMGLVESVAASNEIRRADHAVVVFNDVGMVLSPLN